jgi:hypothetical protein
MPSASSESVEVERVGTEGPTRNFVWDRDDQVVAKRSSKRMANCGLAAVHPLAGIFHSFMVRSRTRKKQLEGGLISREVAAPGLRDDGVFAAPGPLVEGLQRRLTGRDIAGAVDLLQCRGDGAPVLAA